jgi:hypothetical protein
MSNELRRRRTLGSAFDRLLANQERIADLLVNR